MRVGLWIWMLVLANVTARALAADDIVLGPPGTWVQIDDRAWPELPATDAAVQILVQDQQVNLQADGDEYFQGTIVKVQTSQGLASLGSLNITWKPETDTVTVHRLQIRRGASLIDVLAGGQQFTILRREQNLEISALDGRLTANVQLPGLQVGDIVDMAYTLKRLDPVMGGISEQIMVAATEVPVARERLRARWPAAAKIGWHASEALPDARPVRVGSFMELNLSQEDVQPIVQPVGAPLRFAVLKQLELSGFESWADVAARMEPLYEKAAQIGSVSSLNMEMERIRAASPDPVVRAGMALALVQDQVRYVFLGMNDGGLVPADADATWTRRFGDCKAKTALLLALLRGLGLKGEPVAVNTEFGDGMDQRLPRIGNFNHVLVRATIGGRQYWLDGTRSGDRRLTDLRTPAYGWGLPLTRQSRSLVSMVPEPLESPNETTGVTIDASAGLKVPAPFRVEAWIKGDVAVMLRMQLGNLTASERDRALREIWRAKYDFVDIETVEAKFDEELREGRLAMTGKARLEWRNRRYEANGLGVGYRADFTRSPGPASDAPFAVPYPVYERSTETIKLPYKGAGFSVTGRDVDQVVAGIAYRRSTQIKDGEFIGTVETRSISREFPASEAAAAQQALRDLSRDAIYVMSPQGYRMTAEELASEGARSPSDPQELVSRGVSYMNLSKWDEAIADFTKALAADPKSAWALANRGLCHVNKGDVTLANRDLDAAQALDPENPVVFRARGFLAVKERRWPDAITALSRSLELDPGSIWALNQRGSAYLQVRELDKALADAAAILRLDAGSVSAYSLRAQALVGQAKFDEVRATVDAMIKVAPNDRFANEIAAGMLGFMRDWPAATRYATRVIEIAPTPDAYLARAGVRPKDDVAGKLADISAALVHDPKSVRALMFRYTLQISEKDYPAALLSIDAASQALGVEDAFLNERGIVLSLLDRKKDADAAFQKARIQSKEAPQMLNSLCWGKATSNVALERALAECDAALAQTPASAAILDSRAFVMLRMGKFAEAIAGYDKALQVQPLMAASLYGRGVSKHRRGELAAGDRDIAAAKAISMLVEDQFDSYGVKP